MSDEFRRGLEAASHFVANRTPALFETQEELAKQILALTPEIPLNEIEAFFQRFWEAYPKRLTGNVKKTAFEAFKKALNSGVDPEIIIDGAHRYQNSHPDPKYTCMASSWVNQRRWECEFWSAPQIGNGTGRRSLQDVERELNGR